MSKNYDSITQYPLNPTRKKAPWLCAKFQFLKKSQIGGFLSPISTTKNANFGTKLGIPLKVLLVNPFWVSNPFWTLPEKKAPRLSENVNFGSILTKKGPKNHQKMKILKNPSAWSEIYPIVTIWPHEHDCRCFQKERPSGNRQTSWQELCRWICSRSHPLLTLFSQLALYSPVTCQFTASSEHSRHSITLIYNIQHFLTIAELYYIFWTFQLFNPSRTKEGGIYAAFFSVRQ